MKGGSRGVMVDGGKEGVQVGADGSSTVAEAGGKVGREVR